MSNETHNLSHPKFQALAYEIEKLSHIIDQVDIAAYMARSAFNNLKTKYEGLKDKEMISQWEA